jgi:hypothetical protein
MGDRNLPTWVFVAGSYRSGSTTQYQITEDIVTETNNGKGIGYHTEKKLEEFDVPGNKQYVVCKVFEFLPDSFKGGPSYGAKIHADGRMMATVTVRDPRDIMVSMRTRDTNRGVLFNVTEVAKDELPIWLGNVEKWIKLGLDKAYWSKYEEFTLNLLRETRAIAEFLKIPLTVAHAKNIAKRYTITAMEAKKKEFKKKKPEEREHPWLPSIPGVLFGTSGQHKTWLSVQERRAVEENNADFMRRFGYLEGE